MKNILFLAVLSSLSLSSFAAKYTLQGQTDKEESQFLISNLILPNGDSKATQNFFSTIDGLVTGDNVLRKNDALNVIGASGKSIDLVKIFKSHERRALAVGDQELSFVTNYDVDVVCKLVKTGYKYYIHIFTGEDTFAFIKAQAKQKK